MTKNKNKGCITFVGNNAIEVTGSCNLLEYENTRLLLDCGLRQSSKEKEDYKLNVKLNKYIKPQTLNAVILTHIHSDHVCKTPLLFKHHCDCPIYIPKGSKGLITLMLNDTVKIFYSDRDRKGIEPIYTQEDVDCMLSHCVEIDVEEDVNITENVMFRYYYNQHIPKSRSIYIECNDGITTKKIGVTGDFSKYDSTLFLNHFTPLPQVDILISECTYSGNNRTHKKHDRAKDLEKLDTAIREAKRNSGKVIIPTFSNARFQTILTCLYQMYDGDCPIPILCDSKLAHNISSMWGKVVDKDNDIWDNVYKWDKIRWIKDSQERERWMKINQSFIVLCSGGFLSGGTGIPWVKSHLGSTKHRIVFCGYASPDSIAGKIRGQQKTIKIEGKIVKNNAKVVILNSFSSHADRNQLIDYLVKAKYNTLYLVHSEEDSKIEFAKHLKNELSKANRTDKVIATTKNQKAYF